MRRGGPADGAGGAAHAARSTAATRRRITGGAARARGPGEWSSPCPRAPPPSLALQLAVLGLEDANRLGRRSREAGVTALPRARVDDQDRLRREGRRQVRRERIAALLAGDRELHGARCLLRRL